MNAQTAIRPAVRDTDVGPDGYYERNRQWLRTKMRELREDIFNYRESGNHKMASAYTAQLDYYRRASENNNGAPFEREAG